MLYVSEEVFVDKFIACMKLNNHAEFPFDTESFYRGVERMSRFFQENREQWGRDAYEIALLFVKNPIEGVYSRFRDAISEQNGSFVSFENPKYEKGMLKISEEDAREIMEAERISIPNECITSMTNAFCEGLELCVKAS